MSLNGTKVAELKELLAEIHLQDVKVVADTSRAMERMAKLGVSPEQVRLWLTEEPLAPGASTEDEGLFHGFASRYQASLAAFGGMSKKDRPGALGDVADRVNTLIKVQVPERAGTTVGVAIVAIPEMQQLPPPEEAVKRFRRLSGGRLKEITGRPEDDIIDVEAEEQESTVTYKREAK